MKKWYIEINDVDNFRDGTLEEIEIKLQEVGLKFSSDWFPTHWSNAICLPYHGGWIACRQITMDGIVGCGYVYSQDKSLLGNE